MEWGRQVAAVSIAVAMVLIPRAQASDTSLPSTPPRLLPRSGEDSLRLGEFSDARSAFAEAAARNPEDARALWGLGRIELLHFRREAARDLFSKAYRLDPKDPTII